MAFICCYSHLTGIYKANHSIHCKEAGPCYRGRTASMIAVNRNLSLFGSFNFRENSKARFINCTFKNFILVSLSINVLAFGQLDHLGYF